MRFWCRAAGRAREGDRRQSANEPEGLSVEPVMTDGGADQNAGRRKLAHRLQQARLPGTILGGVSQHGCEACDVKAFLDGGYNFGKERVGNVRDDQADHRGGRGLKGREFSWGKKGCIHGSI